MASVEAAQRHLIGREPASQGGPVGALESVVVEHSPEIDQRRNGLRDSYRSLLGQFGSAYVLRLVHDRASVTPSTANRQLHRSAVDAVELPQERGGPV